MEDTLENPDSVGKKLAAFCHLGTTFKCPNIIAFFLLYINNIIQVKGCRTHLQNRMKTVFPFSLKTSLK